MSTRIWRPLTLTTERLDALLPALRSLDADIEKLLHPQLRECPFYADTGVIATPNTPNTDVNEYQYESSTGLSPTMLEILGMPVSSPEGDPIGSDLDGNKLAVPYQVKGLSTLNDDDRLTFDQIADHLEKYAEWYFEEPR